MNPCKCRAAACDRCGSACKKCACECYHSRKRGRPALNDNSRPPSIVPPRERTRRRVSAETAANRIAVCVAADTSTDRLGAPAPPPPPATDVLPRERNVLPRALDCNVPRDLFSFFGWDCYQNMPSLEQRTTLSVDALMERAPNGWSCLRQSTLNAAVHVAGYNNMANCPQ